MEELNLLLTELYRSIEPGGPSRATSLELDSVVQGICSIAARIETSDDDDAGDFARRFCAAALGDRRSTIPSILIFVEDSLGASLMARDVVTRAREHLLNFLANLLTLAGPAVTPHLEAIRITCTRVLQLDRRLPCHLRRSADARPVAPRRSRVQSADLVAHLPQRLDRPQSVQRCEARLDLRQ